MEATQSVPNSKPIPQPRRSVSRSRWRLVLVGATLLGLLAAPGSSLPVAAGSDPVPANVLGVLPLSVRALVDPPTRTPPPLPDDPTAALSAATHGLGSLLGVEFDPGPAIGAAELTPELAGRLSVTLEALIRCHQTSARGLQKIDLLLYGEGAANPPLDPSWVEDIRACALNLYQGGIELELALRSVNAAGVTMKPIDLWPILRFEPGTSNDEYLHDYALLIDMGGNDVYRNNVGGNLLDVFRGPDGSAARQKSPARGCQRVLPRDPNQIELGKECIVSASLLIDIAGNDVYGVRAAPDVDARCTHDPVIRRFVIGGAGFAGVGILIDGSGNDTYTGKTVGLGAGHVGGVGILVDRVAAVDVWAPTNDSYLSIRNGQGFALVSGVGILRDEGGNDSRDFYMPTPLEGKLDPAKNETEGAGGVIDDTDKCDNIPRFIQGAGNVGGIGVLADFSGNDSYRAADSMDGGQGVGANGGTGVLVDLNGSDTYQGPAGRKNGATIPSTSTGVGLFVDQ